MRNLIINTDQNPNKEQNAQMYDQQQQLLVTIATQHMSTRMNQSADCINMPTSTEEDQNAESMQVNDISTNIKHLYSKKCTNFSVFSGRNVRTNFFRLN